MDSNINTSKKEEKDFKSLIKTLRNEKSLFALKLIDRGEPFKFKFEQFPDMAFLSKLMLKSFAFNLYVGIDMFFKEACPFITGAFILPSALILAFNVADEFVNVGIFKEMFLEVDAFIPESCGFLLDNWLIFPEIYAIWEEFAMFVFKLFDNSELLFKEYKPISLIDSTSFVRDKSIFKIELWYFISSISKGEK